MITFTREEAQKVLDALVSECAATLWNAQNIFQAKLKQPYPDNLAMQEPEPVAYIDVETRNLSWAKPTRWETPTVAVMDKVPLYTAPPQREWVGLTDEERANCSAEAYGRHFVLCELIEAKLKEKNGG
jgi:hypothetical protein